jgi:predicted ATP-grasp superfamily ATP-dependent carboligase
MTLVRPCAGEGPRTLVVAGLCVRALAESACQGGWEVIALDLFGDTDTRRASMHWACIGEPSTLRVDPARLRQELQRAARLPRVDGWVPASGFEGAPELLAAGGMALPCLAIEPSAMERVRDPATFFDVLDRHRLPHPGIALDAPAEPAGWLAKRAGGCGGVHIRAAEQLLADPASRHADTYFQRHQPGMPMSALFVADGHSFRVVALNRLIVRAVWPLPHVYAGAVGPVSDDGLEQLVERALSALVPEFGLRGLASLDFLADESGAHWLEVNPRPSASMQLHADAWPAGLVRVHVDAVRGHLPLTAARRDPGVRGHLTVFADRPGLASAPEPHDPVDRPHVHDFAMPGALFARGEPICTVSAEAGSVDDALRLLDARAARVRRSVAPRQQHCAAVFATEAAP